MTYIYIFVQVVLRYRGSVYFSYDAWLYFRFISCIDARKKETDRIFFPTSMSRKTNRKFPQQSVY